MAQPNQYTQPSSFGASIIDSIKSFQSNQDANRQYNDALSKGYRTDADNYLTKLGEVKMGEYAAETMNEQNQAIRDMLKQSIEDSKKIAQDKMKNDNEYRDKSMKQDALWKNQLIGALSKHIDENKPIQQPIDNNYKSEYLKHGMTLTDIMLGGIGLGKDKDQNYVMANRSEYTPFWNNNVKDPVTGNYLGDWNDVSKGREFAFDMAGLTKGVDYNTGFGTYPKDFDYSKMFRLNGAMINNPALQYFDPSISNY